ncbi:MAG: AAA family ATPase [Wolbachia pipientis]
MSSRANIPFLIAGAIASLTLLTSGVFAVAPYVAFLSSVAALNIALPVVFTLLGLSVVVIAFSCKMVRQNKKSQENSKAEVKGPGKELGEEKNTLAPIKEELEDGKAKENKEKPSNLKREADEISELRNEVKVIKRTVSDLGAKFDESAKRIDIAATKDEVEAKLNMEFYAKGEERGWNTTFSDIILPNDIKEKLKGICELQGRGYLLYGPPGTGKTSISKAIANQTKSLFAFMSISASCLSNQSNIDQVFEKAEANSPCIIFIDEIDGIGKKRTGNEDAKSLTQLLTKLDKEFLSSKNITVVAATNYKEHLDPALIRGGRLECIEVPGLDKDDTRQKILQERLEKLKDSDMKVLVQASKGFSMANLICLIDKINETTQKEGEIKYLRTFCKKFKRDHNIKDKRHRNSEIKNGSTRLSSGSSRSLSRSSSVSSSLSDVFSQGSAQQIQQ